MSNSLPPENLAWLRQCAAVDGNTYDRLLLHLLERVESLEARPAPSSRVLAADHVFGVTKMFPTPEAAPPAALSNALISAESALSDIAEGEETNAAPNTFKWAERRCAEALAIIRPVMQQHKICTSEWPPAAQPAPPAPVPLQRLMEAPMDARGYVDLRNPPPAAPAGGLVKRVLRELPSGTDPSCARHAIRAVARWIRSELISRSVADRLEQEADR
jgi:hypothetical protein